MTHSRAQPTALTVVGILLLVASVTILGGHFLGHGRAGRVLSSARLPPGLAPEPASLPTAAAVAPAELRSPKRATASPTFAPNKPGIPVKVSVAGHRIRAAVSSNRLNADGSLFVPQDPRVVSWASQDVGPGSSYGTTILVGHVNFAGVSGVFSDLADYRVGERISVTLADGRTMRYVVAAAPIEVHKDQVGARRQELFDQRHSYGLAGRPKSGRLLLLSCGGVFDNRSGHYQSNIFLYALPL